VKVRKEPRGFGDFANKDSLQRGREEMINVIGEKLGF
jgi:hypothetical protein